MNPTPTNPPSALPEEVKAALRATLDKSIGTAWSPSSAIVLLYDDILAALYPIWPTALPSSSALAAAEELNPLNCHPENACWDECCACNKERVAHDAAIIAKHFPTASGDAEREAIISRAEQACRYALKHQDFTDSSEDYRNGFTAGSQVCESAIRPHIDRHIPAVEAKP